MSTQALGKMLRPTSVGVCWRAGCAEARAWSSPGDAVSTPPPSWRYCFASAALDLGRAWSSDTKCHCGQGNSARSHQAALGNEASSLWEDTWQNHVSSCFAYFRMISHASLALSLVCPQFPQPRYNAAWLARAAVHHVSQPGSCSQCVRDEWSELGPVVSSKNILAIKLYEAFPASLRHSMPAACLPGANPCWNSCMCHGGRMWTGVRGVGSST